MRNPKENTKEVVRRNEGYQWLSRSLAEDPEYQAMMAEDRALRAAETARARVVYFRYVAQRSRRLRQQKTAAQ